MERPVPEEIGRAPLSGESLDGFVARTAAKEGYENTLEITSLAGVKLAHHPTIGFTNRDDLVAVADCMGADIDELVLRSSPTTSDGRRRFFAVEIDYRHFVNRRRLFSPTSLQDKPYHRALWKLRPFPFCEDSWELLQDRCPDPDCGTIQRWHHAMGVDHCDICVTPLTGKAGPRVRNVLQPSLRLLVGLVHPDGARRDESRSKLPPALATMSAGDLLDLACALAGVHDPDIRKSTDRRLFADAASARAVTEAMAAAWRMIETWPTGFERLATDRMAGRVGRYGDGNKGATKAFLALADRRSSNPTMRSVIGELRSGLSRRSRGMELKDAVRRTGLRFSEITSLRRAVLVGTVLSFGGDRPRALLCERDLAVLATFHRSLSFGKAAARLGISYRGVEELVLTGRLEEFEHPAIALLERDRRVMTASVDALSAAVMAVASSSEDDRESAVPLRRLVVAISGIKPWGAILEALESGGIRIWAGASPKTLVDGILVHPDDLGAVHDLRARGGASAEGFADRMSKHDALEALGLHHRQGSSVLTEWPIDFGDTRTIPVAAVDELVRSAISSSEAAARLGVRPLAIVSLLRRHHVPEMAGGLFHRAEAEAVLREYCCSR